MPIDTKINLQLIGISHKTSSVEEREYFQLSRKDIPVALTFLSSLEEVEGVIIISTCNRLEFYFSLQKDINSFSLLDKFYFFLHKTKKNISSRLFYSKDGYPLIEHLFKVSSGLDSLVMGEFQIQGQIKEAYSYACEQKTVSKVLHKLFHAAFRTGKKVRSQTKLSDGKTSVSGVASRLMIEKLAANTVITIIGINENSTIISKALINAGFTNIIYVNRTFYKALMMANDYVGKAADFSQIEQVLFESDAIFSSTGSPGFIVSNDMLKRLEIQDRCPKLIVDMAVPRDIDAHGLSQEIEYFDVGSLEQYLQTFQAKKLPEIQKAEHIVAEEIALFCEWATNQENSLLKDFSEKFELTRQEILKEFGSQFPKEYYAKLDKLTKSLNHRLQSAFVAMIVQEEQKHCKRENEED